MWGVSHLSLNQLFWWNRLGSGREQPDLGWEGTLHVANLTTPVTLASQRTWIRSWFRTHAPVWQFGPGVSELSCKVLTMVSPSP